MTGDRRYEEIFKKKKEGVHSMCDVAERLEQMGIAKGIEIGRNEGKTVSYALERCFIGMVKFVKSVEKNNL